MRNTGIVLILIVGLVMVVGLSGCSVKGISHGTEIEKNQIDTIVDGKTKKSEILLNFGQPSKTMDDEKVFFYSWTRGSKVSVLGLGKGSAKGHTLVVLFDENGVVSNHKITRGDVAGGAAVGD